MNLQECVGKIIRKGKSVRFVRSITFESDGTKFELVTPKITEIKGKQIYEETTFSELRKTIKYFEKLTK